jgi:hypothetical protein
MRSPFYNHIENPSTSAAGGGRLRLRLFAIHQTNKYMMPDEGHRVAQHRQPLTPKELSDTIHRPASSWTGTP